MYVAVNLKLIVPSIQRTFPDVKMARPYKRYEGYTGKVRLAITLNTDPLGLTVTRPNNHHAQINIFMTIILQIENEKILK